MRLPAMSAQVPGNLGVADCGPRPDSREIIESEGYNRPTA